MKNIIIAGVGGQGVVLVSKIIGQALCMSGYDVKISEVHGMSQRGGSVVSFVRFGDKVCSPIVDIGECDYILAFEKLEAARWEIYLKQGASMIVNDCEIKPISVILGEDEYPKFVMESLKRKNICVDVINAFELAKNAGSSKAMNIVMLGRLARNLDVPWDIWEKSIEKCVKTQLVDANKKAFLLGLN